MKELIGGGNKGRNANDTTEALEHVSRHAFQEGGSSYIAFDQLVDQLRGCKM